MKSKKLTKTQLERLRGLLLAHAGLTIPMVARKHGVSRQFAYQALRGYHASDKAEAIRDYVNSRVHI